MNSPRPQRLFTLGRLALQDADGRVIASADQAKPLGVLAYIAFAPGRQASRDRLIDHFFANRPTDKARASLRTTLSRIRRLLGTDALGGSGESDPVRLTAKLWTDRGAFLDALDASRIAEAIELYQGPFFPGLVSAGSASFEHWADLERARLEAHFLDAVQLAGRQALGGDDHHAHELTLRGLSFRPHDQRLWRIRLEAESRLFARGRLAISVSELRHCLAEEGVELEQRTKELLEHLEARSDAQRLNEDPVPQGELVGRAEEFTSLYEAWVEASGRRVVRVHITAPPGFGKTRLLADFATRMAADSQRNRVVEVRASPMQRALPWSAAADLIHRVALLSGSLGVSVATAAVLVDLVPALGGRYAQATPRFIPDREERSRARIEAISDLMSSVLHDGALVLLLDDLHWWDSESLTALTAVVERTRDLALLIVTAARPTMSPFAERVINLSPLSRDEVHELIASMDRQQGEEISTAIESLWLASQGSPLLVTEAVRLGISRGAVGVWEDGLDFSDSTRFFAELRPESVLENRVARLTEEQQYTLQIAAILGAGFPSDAPEPFQGFRAACLALEQSGLLIRSGNGTAIAHDRLSDVVNGSMTVQERTRAHRGAVSILSPIGNSPALARHLLAADDPDSLLRSAIAWVREHRQHGDRRSARDIVNDLLPEAAPEVIRGVTSSLPLALRRPRHVILHGAWAAVALVLIAGWKLAGDTSPDPLLLGFDLITRPDGSTSPYSYERVIITIPGGGENPGRPMVTRRTIPNPPITRLVSDKTGLFGVHGPDSTIAWVTNNAPGEPNGPTSLAIERSGQIEPVGLAPGDDVAPSWSPDLRYLAFQTTRYAAGAGSFDLAVLDVRTLAVTPLVVSPDKEAHPKWSPDGRRIAFVRSQVDRGEDLLCWTTVPTAVVECNETAGVSLGIVAGWAGLRSVYVITNDPANQLIKVDLIDGSRQTVLNAEPGATCLLSPDHRWFACTSRPSSNRSGSSPTITIYDVLGRLPQPIVVQVPEGSAEPNLIWHQPPIGDFTVRLSVPDAPVRVVSGIPSRPSVALVSSDGERWPIPASVARWHSADSTIASADTQGINGLRLGSTWMVASVGTYRSDSLGVDVVERQSRISAIERWDSTWRDRWTSFGDPQPVASRASPGTGILLVNGDGEFDSGALSKTSFDPTNGIAVEMSLALPITKSWWQHLSIQLGVENPSMPGRFYSGHCDFRAPAGEGARSSRLLRIDNMHLTDTSGLLSGGTWLLRLQLFPDGSCGIAINGRARYRSESSIVSSDRMKLRIGGQSVHTRIQVGKVTIWEGVPPGVNWAQFPAPIVSRSP